MNLGALLPFILLAAPPAPSVHPERELPVHPERTPPVHPDRELPVHPERTPPVHPERELPVHPERSRGGRIAGTVSFNGRSLKPVKVQSTDPACKGAVAGWEPRALVRLTTNAPSGPVPSTPVLIEEKGCMFHPWLSGAMKGQGVVLRNADGTTHSVRAAAGDTVLFNVIQPPNGKELPKAVPVAGVVKLGCDLHPWMGAFVVVSDHPYFALTAADGSFRIEGVPPGTYGVEAWNPRLGTLKAEVVVEEGKAADPKFSFSLK